MINSAPSCLIRPGLKTERPFGRQVLCRCSRVRPYISSTNRAAWVILGVNETQRPTTWDDMASERIHHILWHYRLQFDFHRVVVVPWWYLFNSCIEDGGRRYIASPLLAISHRPTHPSTTSTRERVTGLSEADMNCLVIEHNSDKIIIVVSQQADSKWSVF